MIPKRVVKFLFSDIYLETRDKREILLLREIGYEVVVLCGGEKTERLTTEPGVLIYKVERLRLTRSQPRLFRAIKIINKMLFLEKMLKSMHADCISCHDLYALLIGWISTWFVSKKRKPLLVYDSHEFEIGRNTKKKRSVIMQLLVAYAEKFLMKRCVFSIMVNDSIADAVQRIHRLKNRPIVVRSIPPYWNIDKMVCQKHREEFCKTLNVSSDDTFIAIHHGMITKGRGVETLIEAIAGSNKTIGVVLGYSEEGYLESLKKLSVSCGVVDRMLFHPAVPVEELWKYVGAADVEVIVVEILFKSYFFGLPNKFFESIQSITPIICNNTPEMANIIKEYDIGLVVEPPGDLQGLVAAIKTMQTDKELYGKFKQNLMIAKRELSWDKEQHALANAYKKVLPC